MTQPASIPSASSTGTETYVGVTSDGHLRRFVKPSQAGPANVLSVGTVTTLASGASAAATITGTTPAQILNLDLPRGETGPTGLGDGGLFFRTRTGAASATIDAAIKAVQTGGYAAVGDGGGGDYVRLAAAPLDPTNPGYFRSIDRYKADGTTDGTNGGYWGLVAKNSALTLEQFGGKADYYLVTETAASTVNPSPTDNRTAFNYANDYLFAYINNYQSGGARISAAATIQFGYGTYYLTDEIVPTRTLCLKGMGVGYYHDGSNSRLMFAAGKRGIVCNAATPVIGGVGSTAIRDLYIACVGAGGQTTKHGIVMDTSISIENCSVANFGGNGIDITADVTGGTNANSFYLARVVINACVGHGVYCSGGDANAGVGIAISCLSNGGWGINDSSFLGNTWVACHTSGNTLGPYYANGGNARAVFIGCYAEQDQTTSTVNSPSLVLGGFMSSGVSGDGVHILEDYIGTHSSVYKGTSVTPDLLDVTNRFRPNMLQSVYVNGGGFGHHWCYEDGWGLFAFRYGDSVDPSNWAYTITTEQAVRTYGKIEPVSAGNVSFPKGIFVGGDRGSATDGERWIGNNRADQWGSSGGIRPNTYGAGDTLLNALLTGGQHWAWVCSTAGAVAEGAWTAGQNYANWGDDRSTLISNAGHYYRLVAETLGSETLSVDAPVHTVGDATGATDGHTWRFLTSTPAVLKRFGPLMGATSTTTSDPIFDLAQTWNNGAVTFTGLKANFTSTASAAGSLMLDLQIGGTSKWNVDKGGTVTQAGGLTLAGAVAGVTTLGTTGLPTFKSGTAPAAGGTQFVQASSTAGLGFYFGTGAPSISAGKGSIYSNTTATTTTTRLYVNTDGGTTWANFTASA